MAVEPSASRRGSLDRLAIGVSALCLLHCFATAIFVGLVASLGTVLGNPVIHEAGLAVGVVLGAVALGRGIVQHRRFVPAATGGLGLAIMAAALFVPHGMLEAVVTMIGVCTLALGHYLNRLAFA
jgi:uncharacterized protein (DUF697 family)